MQILKRVQCPQCGSARVWKDGFRVLADGRPVQRFLCRSCGFRFSFSQGKNKGVRSDRLMLKLEKIQRFAGISPKIRGKLIEFSFWLMKQGYAKSTIESQTKLLKILASRGADLFDPESVKEVIAQQEWSEGRKENAVDAYTNFLRMCGRKWNPPRYKRIRKLPFIPTEKELDDLIAGCGPKTSTFLQLLKETGVRAGEAWQLEWTDIDFINKTIRVKAEKRSDPRIFRVSDKLLAMLSRLPKNSKRVFGDYPLRGFARGFQRQRKRIAEKLQNPRLLQISFHTFRHWKATTLYYQTKDILYVMKFLGHRNIKNTLVYTQLAKFSEKDEFVCKVAANAKEAKKLVESGFQYVCTTPEGLMLFRKRK